MLDPRPEHLRPTPPPLPRLAFPLLGSVLAGCYGAALGDTVGTLLRSTPAPSFGHLLLLALALYGAAGLVAGVLAELALRGLTRTLGPGGFRRLRADATFDEQAATGVLTAALGVFGIALGLAVGHVALVSGMASERLQTIAVFGLVPIAAVPSAVVSLALLPWLRALARRIPGASKVRTLLLAFAVLGVLAVIAAFSRADWRVLDLGPFGALVLAVLFGVPHGLFWYGSLRGQRLRWQLPVAARWGVLAAGVIVPLLAWPVAASFEESDPLFGAVASSSLGLRRATNMARALTDHDHDGFSARFGGGDCDDRRADVYPGAEEVPGDGIDQNCEGGDAPAEPQAEAEPAEATPEPAAEVTAAKKGKAPPSGKSGDAAGAGADKDAAAVLARLKTKGNFLFVTIDALRGDRLGVAGYERPAGRSLTPTMDALAARGTYFRRAWSQAPNTPRSFPSILTGRYPSDVHWDKPTVNYPVVLPSNHTFFEDLRSAGLRTIGIFSHFYFVPERGISKGFDEWSDDGAGTIAESNKDIASPRIVPRVIARLKQAAAKHERFALWTHLFEPHSSYMTHKEFPLSGASGAAGLMEKYDYEIAYVDRWVGKLLKAVEELGLAQDTVVVLMADHGEAWGEHKTFFHGQDLFDEQLRIPLIVVVPGLPAHKVTTNVAAVDVAPTVLGIFGLAAPRGLRGASLLPAVLGEEIPSHVVFSELMPATAWPHHAAMMVEDDLKLIHRISDRRFEMYALGDDPKEQKDLSREPGRAAKLQALKAKLLGFEERRR